MRVFDMGTYKRALSGDFKSIICRTLFKFLFLYK